LAAPAGTALTGAAADDRGFLLTTTYGVLHLDPRTGDTRPLLETSGTRSAAVRTSSALTVLCGTAAITQDADGAVTALGGPFPNAAHLQVDDAGTPWVFATTGPPPNGRHTLTRLGSRPEDQVEHTIDFVGGLDAAALLPGGRLYLVGGVHGGVLDIVPTMSFPRENWQSAAPISTRQTLLAYTTETVLTAGRSQSGAEVSVYTTDLRTHQHTLLLTVDANRAVALMKGSDHGVVYLIVDAWLPKSAMPRPVLLEIKFNGPFHPRGHSA
jgi:hypothetical protein